MDEWIIWFVIVAIVVYFSAKKQKEEAGYSKEYHKKQSEYNQKAWFTYFVALGVMVVGLFMSFTSTGGIGWILLIAGLIGMFLPSWLYEEEGEELKKMAVKEQKEQEYQSELVKERARLQARKEEKK